MNPSTTELTLNMQLPNIATVSWAVQGDQLSRQIIATLVDGSAAWEPQSGYHGAIRAHKPDGTACFYDVDENGDPAVTWNGNVATLAIVQQALTAPGTVLMQLEFYDSNNARISAFGWAMNVQPSAVTDTEFLSTDYYNILALQIAGVLGASSHPPYINSSTKNWMLWDENAAEYVDSGYPSRGEQGPAPVLTGTSYQYANSNSGTTIPTSWSDTKPATVPGTWSWTKVTLIFNNTQQTVYYVVAYQGNDGTGAAGSSLPLMDGTASAGSANAYSREDHVHPTDTSVPPLWRGKHALIIGDSWIGGYNGSSSVTPWCSYFLAMTGLTAELLQLSGAGFVKTAHTGDYTGYNFVSVLDSVQNNSYDIIIFQGGANDVVTSTVTASNIASAFASLRTKCDTYFPGVPVYYFPTMPFYFLTNQISSGTEDENGENSKAVSLVHNAITNGVVACKQCAKFGFYNTSYKGTDYMHPSATGHEFMGKYAASFLISGYFPNDQNKMINADGIPWFSPNIQYVNVSSNPGLSTRYFDGTVGISLDIVLDTDTYGSILTVAKGFPYSGINYSSGNAYYEKNGVVYCVAAFARKDEIYVDLRRATSSMRGTIISVLLEYRTSSL